MINLKILSDENKLITAMEMMDNSKGHLLFFIKMCGINNDHKEYKRINFLINSKSELDQWMSIFSNEFESDIDFLSEVSDKFKMNKIASLNIQLNEFVASCLDADSTLRKLKNGLENFFQVECSNEELMKINQKIHSNELSLEFIYKKFKDDNWYNTAGKFARSNWNVDMSITA